MVEMPRTKRSVKVVARATATAAGLCILLVLPLEAFAGNCTSSRGRPSVTSNGYWDGTAAADTTLRNNSTGLTIEAEILRGDGVKSQKTIGPGQQTGHLAKFGGTGKIKYVDFTVVAKAEGQSLSCAYRIKWDVDYLFWDLAEGADTPCGDPSVFCPTCKVSCSATFHAGKARWNTTFTVSD
jgi:hypothetical protein